ncbi:nuclear transport factor 2 family protein [Streptomyces albipurpureus]|uniref:Nuclear transport factor 2 family protein n=1 Tax=Streptomyces albipurpureus TaxID=2897419 RepID=A0ABT0V2F4_9ACTN|nr:nuclear transport factor 2 family protein [Streptomyces sp. CWNU-1]MCM2393728.1 nuclear transport factor 2 family protein [Streptomyces sp. CWNU-1]
MTADRSTDGSTDSGASRDAGASRAADEAALARLLTSYAWCVDDKRWEDWEACFTPDAEVRMPFASHNGSAGLAEWGRAALAPFERTHHMSANIEVTVTGATAVGRSKFQAVHVPEASRPSEHFTEAGTYLWAFRRTPDGWRISRCEIETAWTAGRDTTGLAGGH